MQCTATCLKWNVLYYILRVSGFRHGRATTHSTFRHERTTTHSTFRHGRARYNTFHLPNILFFTLIVMRPAPYVRIVAMYVIRLAVPLLLLILKVKMFSSSFSLLLAVLLDSS